VRCCGCALGAMVLIVLVAVGVAAYMGFVPGLSGLIGTNKPRDLSVRYSPQDANDVYGKAQIQVSQPEYLCFGCQVEFSGQKTVDARFTDAEVTALLNAQNQKYGELKDIQVKFNADQTVELTALAARQASVPIYVKAIPKVAPGGKLDLTVVSVEVAHMPVPTSMLSQYTGGADLSNGMQEVSDTLLKQAGILELTDLRVEAGQIYFKGVVPKTIKGVAPPPGTTGNVK
jgi:uncharacterized protein YpmS